MYRQSKKKKKKKQYTCTNSYFAIFNPNAMQLASCYSLSSVKGYRVMIYTQLFRNQVTADAVLLVAYRKRVAYSYRCFQ